MADRRQILEKLQAYVKKIQETEHATFSTEEQESYESRLEVAYDELTEREEQESSALEELRVRVGTDAISQPSPDPKTRLRQLHIITAAYKELTPAVPDLPHPDSPIPALIAARNTKRLIAETQDCIATTHAKLSKARTRLSQEQTELADAKALTSALEDRIARLRIAVAEQSQKSPEELAQAALLELQERQTFYKKETRRLVKALVVFINERLAPLLAAEELGGPVVGDVPEVSDEALEAGFSGKGAAKKIKPQTQDGEEKRRRRIDQIWGPQDEGEESLNEKEAAATEMRDLVEELLNVAAEEGAGVYIDLTRDSAASRFLVRVKVAQFHPKDARKLRLIDFGRVLDD